MRSGIYLQQRKSEVIYDANAKIIILAYPEECSLLSNAAVSSHVYSQHCLNF